MQPSGTTASLRGVSAVSAKVAWASGTAGTVIRTTDGGTTWVGIKVAGGEELDFRDIEAFNDREAYLLASGPGAKSRIYKTTNGGANWNLLLRNPDEKGFFDSIAFWDRNHGIAVGDPVGGTFVLMTTDDGGASWIRQSSPHAVPNEGAFAASGTCIIVTGNNAWFVSGGVGAGRVFRSTDRGRTWSVATTPIRNDVAAAGIFSIAMDPAGRGVIVGGDYTKPTDPMANIGVTGDFGKTWSAPSSSPGGHRSAVVKLPASGMWITTGASGSDFSTDQGRSWTSFDKGAFHALSFATPETGWAVGPQGRVARFRRSPVQ